MVEVILGMKSGKTYVIPCDDYVITKDFYGRITNLTFKGLKNTNPIFIDIAQVEIVYSRLSGKDRRKFVKAQKELLSQMESENENKDETA